MYFLEIHKIILETSLCDHGPWQRMAPGSPSITWINRVKRITSMTWKASSIELAAHAFDWGLNAKKIEGLFSELTIAAPYVERSCHTCEWLAALDAANASNATNCIDLGEGRVVNLPKNLQNKLTWLNRDAAAVVKGACLVGEAAESTLKGLPGTACCSGYPFNVLSTEEAFMV